MIHNIITNNRINISLINKKRYFKKYCIVNSETLEIIKKIIPAKSIFYYDKSIKIYGLEVAICENLKLGEFELK